VTPPQGPVSAVVEAGSNEGHRNVGVAAFMTFAAFLGLGFALPFLPIFVQDLGVRDPGEAAQWAGVLIGVGPLLAGLLAPFWGGRADRHGYKRVALLALGALGFSQFVAALAQSPLQVLVSRVLSGLFGGVGPLGLAMATSGSTKTGGGSSAIGRIQAAQILAAGLGPLLGGALASTLGIRAAFVAAGFCCLLAALVVGVLYRDAGRSTAAMPSPRASFDGRAPQAFFGALVFVVFLVNFASRSFTPILPGQLHMLGVAPGRVALGTGIVISVYSLSAAASSFGFGKAALRADPVRLLGGSLFLSLLSAVAMAYAPTFPLFLVIALVFGLVSGGALTLGYSIGARRFGESARGALFGKLSGAALIGGAVAPAIAGFVARSSLRDVYWMNAAVYLALIGISTFFLRESRSSTSASGGARE